MTYRAAFFYGHYADFLFACTSPQRPHYSVFPLFGNTAMRHPNKTKASIRV
jgi:hypothetical protein